MSRPLPQAREAEESVIGAVFLDPSAVDRLNGLEATDFYTPAHQAIFESIERLKASDTPVDVVTVVEDLRQASELDKVGGSAYLTQLVDKTPSASNVDYYAGLVADASHRRQLIRTAHEVAEAAHDGGSPDQITRLFDGFTPARASSDLDHLVDGYTFYTSEAAQPSPRWGNKDGIMWAKGEPLMVAAATGVGKTTLSQLLALGMIGVGPPQVLGFPVVELDGPVLYVAADRPDQIARSGARLIGAIDEEATTERMRVWRGPLPFNLSTADPRRLADWVEKTGCVAVILDSLMNVATDLTKDEVGSRVAQSFTHVVARGIDLVVNHHDRKAGNQTSGRRKPAIDDIYGSRFLTASMGSVIYLDGSPGTPIARLHHMKSPTGEIPQFDVLIDHESGTIERDESRSPYQLLKRSQGMTPKQLAQSMFGDTERANVEKARRQLEKLVGKYATKQGGGDPNHPVTYYAVADEQPPDEGAP